MRKGLFGTDGIRGEANRWPMDVESISRVGAAAGSLFLKTSGPHRAVIGKDTRLSSYMVEQALTAGLLSVGANVFLFGPIPTPAVGMLTSSLRADVGFMISASHNPFHDNGIKMFGPDGFKISPAEQDQIEHLTAGAYSQARAEPRAIGRAKRIEDAQARYIEYVKATFPKEVSLTGLRIVVDCANGAAYEVAPAALWELGAEIIEIGTEPNGFNINDKCGSTAPERLCSKVRQVRADLGIAFDGDADRVIFADEKGKVVDGDQLIGLIARKWQQSGQLRGRQIVTTVMSNLGLERYLKGIGLKAARTPVGDRHIINHMRKHNLNVGGEQSGHIVLLDYGTTGDALVAALQLLALIVNDQKPVSEICHLFDPLPQISRNVTLANGEAPDQPAIRKLIDGLEARLKGEGRLLIRKSGTEPCVRIMAEGEDEALIAEIAEEAAAALLKKVA
ncbi:MAG: phosphoglucosamine mutase [Pseudomonadota bacterium]